MFQISNANIVQINNVWVTDNLPAGVGDGHGVGDLLTGLTVDLSIGLHRVEGLDGRAGAAGRVARAARATDAGPRGCDHGVALHLVGPVPSRGRRPGNDGRGRVGRQGKVQMMTGAA